MGLSARSYNEINLFSKSTREELGWWLMQANRERAHVFAQPNGTGDRRGVLLLLCEQG